MQKMLIKCKFPSLNDYTLANRTSKIKGNEMKQEFTNIVAWEAKKQLKIITHKPVDIKFTWIEKNMKRDPDNICFARKFILDGIVRARILENDTHKYINSFTDDFELADFYGVELTII